MCAALRPIAPLALALVLVGGLIAVAPAPAAAGTAETMEASILSWMNRDRAARGLRPLYRHSKLIDLAGDRAAVLASKGLLSHTAAGSLTYQLSTRRIQWWSYGENIGRTTAAWGSTAASSLYSLWKASSPHWANMMSRTFNYVGIGVAYRSSTRSTYAVIVFTESVDQTRPWARMTDSSRSGTSVTWKWTGADRLLQTHTSGLRDFDVQYRTGSGSWVNLRTDTTATTLTLADRPRGTSVALRVRSRDRRGYHSDWSAELRVAIP
jgi:uncharacterized protein YkwD